MDEEILNWPEGQALTGYSDLQVRFCQHLLEGKSKTQAARDAGYGGDGTALRATASRAASSQKVRALLAWARAGGAGLSAVPGDESELRKILWRHARSADVTRSIRGVEALTKLENADREAAAMSKDPWLNRERRIAESLQLDEPLRSNWTTAFVLMSSPTALSCLPMLHDFYPVVSAAYPEVWDNSSVDTRT